MYTPKRREDAIGINVTFSGPGLGSYYDAGFYPIQPMNEWARTCVVNLSSIEVQVERVANMLARAYEAGKRDRSAELLALLDGHNRVKPILKAEQPESLAQQAKPSVLYHERFRVRMAEFEAEERSKRQSWTDDEWGWFWACGSRDRILGTPSPSQYAAKEARLLALLDCLDAVWERAGGAV
jgi:hypothetical protein